MDSRTAVAYGNGTAGLTDYSILSTGTSGPYRWRIESTDEHDESVSNSTINLFRRHCLTGGHEVIVESPHHLQSISQLDHENTQLVFTAYRDQLRYWLDMRELAYAVVFKNVGLDAGASLAHTHSQLIATDILPTDIAFG